MESLQRRLVSRHHKVKFTLMQANGRNKDMPANDASTRAALFDVKHRETVLGAKAARFKLDGRRYATVGPLREAKAASSRGFVVDYVTEQEQGTDSTTDRLHERYHSPNFWKRLVRAFQRVSRIHLYEAQERFIHLVRLLDKYDSV